ncbi:MAG TPA: hypothetical protein VHC22_25115 [Pirellulales bacterium]|nr:hypothetical protein [Pirellulales bacterium]
MADTFDPYRKWLGISPKDQPPNHYRLLGIETFENDPDVIEGAADRQMSHLRTFQTGPHSAHSQRLLNECAAARVALLDPQKKAEYDRLLREQMEVSSPPADLRGADAVPGPPAGPQHAMPLPVAAPLPQAEPLFTPENAAYVIPGVGSPTSIQKRLRRKPPLWKQPAVLGAVSAAVLFGLIAYYLFGRGAPPREVAVENPPASDVENHPVTEAAAPADTQSSDAPPPDRPSNVSTPSPTSADPPSAPSEQPQTGLTIIEATWSAGENSMNVTEGVRRLVKDDRLMMIIWSALFGAPENAPGPGAKRLRIAYRLRGKEYTVEYPDSHFVYLDGRALAPPLESPEGFELLEARYGAGHTFVDVLTEAGRYVRDGRLSVNADQFAAATADELAKDGIHGGTFKVLWVRYRTVTGEHFHYAWNSQLLTVDPRLPEAAGPPVDLLDKIDEQRDAVWGLWTRKDGRLLAPGEVAARIEIPFDVPGEYALTVVAEPETELRDVNAGLVVGGRQVLANIDGGADGTSGLAVVDGIWPMEDDNPTKPWRLIDMLEQGRPNTLTYVVRPSSVRVLRDGAEICRWSGDARSLSVPPTWEIRDPHRLYLQSYNRPYRISKVELVPLAQEKSPVLVAKDSAGPVDVLKSIDLDRDRLHGDWTYDGAALVTPESDRGPLQVRLPVVVPSEYRLDVVAQREAGNDCLAFALPVGGKVAELIIDGGQGTLAGLQMIDGKDFATNESRREASIFADGKPHSVAITVRDKHVQLACDGHPILDWTGDLGRISSSEGPRYRDRIYLGNWFSRYRLTKIELTPLGGESESETTPPPKPSESPNATPPARKFAELASDNAKPSIERLAVPDDETLKKARPEVQKEFSARIMAAKAPEQKRTLVRELAQKALADDARGAKAYVLLNQAIDLAEAAGDIDLAWQTIDQLAQSFEVDRLTRRNESLAEMGKTIKSPERAWEMADAACRLLALALADGDAALVKKTAAQAQSFGKRTKDRALQKQITNRANDAVKLAGELDAVAAARETLKTSADDPQANFTVGHYELCAAGDWRAALPKLAKAEDTAWRQLARDELALGGASAGNGQPAMRNRFVASPPAETSKQLATADGWWSRAEQEPWPARHYLHMRAAHWYGMAHRFLADVERARSADRIRTLLASDEGLPNWELFAWRNQLTGQVTGDIVRLDGRGGLETAVEFGGSIEVTIVARSTTPDIRLMTHNWNWNWKWTVPQNQWHTLRFVITPLTQSVFADGALAYVDPNPTSTVTRSALPLKPGFVFLLANESVLEVKKFVVRSLE